MLNNDKVQFGIRFPLVHTMLSKSVINDFYTLHLIDFLTNWSLFLVQSLLEMCVITY